MTSSCIPLKSAKIAMLASLRFAQKLGYDLNMKPIFSFVIDADLRFVAQTRLFLASLMAQAVPARTIHAHVTPNTGKAARTVLQKAGVNSHSHPRVDAAAASPSAIAPRISSSS
jgi:hypothetical protein